MFNKFKWALLLVRDIVKLGVVNRSYLTMIALLGLLSIALAIIAVEVSAPFIYTLF
jgi:hypothetical protein